MNSQPNVGNVKCHKCRQVLLSDLSATYNKSRCKDTCSSYNRNNFIYLLEDHLPAWIKVKIEEEQWTKGKLHCENCGCKVGTFDFVSGRKCECGITVLPPVHFVLSQVDIPILIPNLK
uniref:E3 ubiquitin-protein ligase RNF180 n=1 Tax=Pararge aegeria TaxID=116150 RepID=S4P3U6_9NEOP